MASGIGTGRNNMTRRDWWLGIGIVTAALLLLAWFAFPFYRLSKTVDEEMTKMVGTPEERAKREVEDAQRQAEFEKTKAGWNALDEFQEDYKVERHKTKAEYDAAIAKINFKDQKQKQEWQETFPFPYDKRHKQPVSA